jgi:3-(3-hydroxy-phenyl)propionate hydroxylase
MTLDSAVLIVGAGPVGLVAASRLAALNVKTILLEALDAPAADLRASTFHPPTLEMLDCLGLAEPLLKEGLVSPSWQVRLHETGERALFDLGVLGTDTPYPFRLQCEQSRLCALAEQSMPAAVEVRRGVRVTRIIQNESSVAALLEDGSRVTARYLIGADGARSTVRAAMRATFEGTTYPETTILATTRFPFEAHLEGLSNVNYCWSEFGTFSLLRLPGIWRCSLHADAGETTEQALLPDSIEAKLQRVHPQADRYALDEVRPYRIHQRIASTYRDGRLLLAGDSAHLNSPSGGMGMNGGIHDAFSLSEKLASVLSGADDRLLDRYSRQRRRIAQEQILAQADRNRARMRERDPQKRRTELARLQAIAADAEQARRFLLRSSMIEGLRQAEEIA